MPRGRERQRRVLEVGNDYKVIFYSVYDKKEKQFKSWKMNRREKRES